MIINAQYQILQNKARLDQLRYWVIFGVDQGRVALVERELIGTYVANGYNHVVLAYDKVKDEISETLFQLLGTSSLFGGGNIVSLRHYEEGSSHFKDLRTILDQKNFPGILIVTTKDLKKGVGLRKFAEDSTHVGSIQCYKQSKQETASYVTDFLTKHGVQYEKNVPQFLATIFPPDQLCVYNELEKIATYVANATEVLSINKLNQLVLDQGEIMLNDLCAAFIHGNSQEIISHLKKAEIHGTNFMLILRSLQNYIISVLQIKSVVAREKISIESAIENAKISIFGHARIQLSHVIQNHSVETLNALLKNVIDTEVVCKSGAQDPALCYPWGLLNLKRCAG